MKIIRTLLLVATLVFAGMLWFTKAEWLDSQSAFALSKNVHWYILMHLSIAITFVLDDIKYDRMWSSFVALAVCGIVVFDMYHYPMVHNIMTGTMAALAVGNIIWYAPAKERPYAILNTTVGALFFLLGFLVWDVHLFFGEVIIEFTLGVAMARRIWSDDEDYWKDDWGSYA